MESDSMSNASVASFNPREIAKKKRANRSAKLKQCKLDARREQWLSHVKNKGECKEEVSGGGTASGGQSMHLDSQKSQRIGKMEINTRTEEIYADESTIHNCSDSESVPSNSPTSVSGSNDSGANFTASSSSSSSTNCFCLGNMSEEDEDGDCLDDWEALADALAANENKQQNHNTNKEPSPKRHEHSAEYGSQIDVDQIHMASANLESGRTANRMINCCAWRADDASRPQSLPNLSKQYSFPLKSERHFGRGLKSCQNVGTIPTSCPICYEDLDNTDSSFLPCGCGFMLCLFCYKRIIEENGRCPGCRQKYEVELNEGEAILDGRSLTFGLHGCKILKVFVS